MPAENDQMRWLILRHIAEHVECVACHHNFAPEEVQILSHSNDLWFIRVTCDRCGAEGIVLVTVESRRPAVHRAALPDFSVKVQPAVASSRPITEGEIEELRHFLDDFHGNFSEWDKA